MRVERELGGGGMSRVFVATELSLDRQVVIKVLAPELAAGVSADRFRREIQLVAKLQHPHIVPILSAGDAEGALYYVMPFLRGDSLRARITREGRLPVRDTVQILREVLGALSTAHEFGVVHRDIKPENILSGAGHAVIADFGVSKALQDSGSRTTAGIALGTPAYMAPEQIAADPNTDQRADLYAAAVVAYEMLTGAPPFDGTPGQLLKAHLSEAPVPVGERRGDVPPALAALIMRALEKDPDQRPQTAAEMIAALDAMSSMSSTSPATAAPSSSPGSKRVRLGVMVGVAALAIAGAVGIWTARRPVVVTSAQSIAIAPFSVADGDTALVRLARNLVTTISANVDGVGDIRTADPMAMLSQAKSSGGMLTTADAAGLALKLGATSVLHGTLTRVGNLVRVAATLNDASNPQTVVARLEYSLPSDSISALTDSLTWGLLRQVWKKGKAPTPYATSVFTRSPQALREFLQGEQLFARGGIIEATAAYERAIAADTTFWFAHYRYKIARDWFGFPLDTTITHRLARHLRDLPQRERAFLLARDSFATYTDRFRNLEAVMERYPDYTPALLGYADLLVHHGMRVGREVKEGIAPWRRMTELMPSDMESTAHLSWACMLSGDLPCAARASGRLDSLVRADSALWLSQLQSGMLAFALRQRTPAMLDSLRRETARDSVPRFPIDQLLHYFGDVAAADPQFLADHDAAAARYVSTASPAVRDSMRVWQLTAGAMRGASASLDTALSILDASVPPAGRSGARQRLLRGRVLHELQGLLVPDAAIGAAALAAANAPGASRASAAELRWIAAANAMVRGDSSAYRARLVEFARDTTAHARIAVRSLRGIALGRSGNIAAAAESLLVLERSHGDSLPKLWGAYGADRLLAADWLSRGGRFAPADSLLRFTEGGSISAMAETAGSVFGAAMLQRSRIAEGLGNKTAAIRYASIFTGMYDKPSPAAKAQTDEARERLVRLRGTDAAKR